MAFKFSANLSMLFTEAPFLDRFERAAKAGFEAVEFLFPYEWSQEELEARLSGYKLRLALFNLQPGDSDKGEWGLLSVPGREASFRSGFDQALEIARRLGCRRIHAMFGNRVGGVPPEEQIGCAVENLRWASAPASKAGVTLLVEPLNAVDFPGFFLHRTNEVLGILDKVDRENVRLQYDVYHAQMTEGNLIASLRAHIDRIGHIQIADVPGRHEPGTGEINYPAVFSALEDLGYDGYVGLEYRPATTTEESLGWMARG
jgi:hydroxypyruvate isomerase